MLTSEIHQLVMNTFNAHLLTPWNDICMEEIDNITTAQVSNEISTRKMLKVYVRSSQPY